MMNLPSNQMEPRIPRGSGADWKVLGELEVSLGADADAALRDWLAEILRPLDLPADFQNKVLNSAREAAARLTREETLTFDHIHLLILVPTERASKRGTWGFFRIEKIEAGGDHAIEFYLYVEGR